MERGIGILLVSLHARERRACRLYRDAHGPDEIELGYVLARAFWGRGFMLEAIAAVVVWAFVGRSRNCVMRY